MVALLLKCLALWGVVKGSLLNIHMHFNVKEESHFIAVYVFNKMGFYCYAYAACALFFFFSSDWANAIGSA